MSRVMAQTKAPEPTPRKRRPGGDAVTFLTIYLVLLCTIPSYLIIPALGSVGRLSVLWGLVGFVWWSYSRVELAAQRPRGPGPVKFAALIFFGVVLTSYAVAQLRGLPIGESTTADSSLIRMVSWAGVLMVAMDGVNTRERFLVLIRRMVIVGALMSALGLVQFATGQSYVNSLSIPGFEVSGDFESVHDRAGFARSAATASHPLEYGAVLCLTLPLSIALGMFDAQRKLILRWAPAFVILVAASLSMSRSAMIGILVGLVLLMPSIPAHYRARAVLVAVALVTGLAFLVPGMIGTIRGMFNGIGTDASTTSRTDSAGHAMEIALRDPWVGRGFGTHQPSELIMDNQLLLSFIEIGIFGLAAFAILVAMCMAAGWRMGKLSGLPQDKILGPALTSSIAAGTTTLLFFDGFTFPIAAGMLFLAYGMAGAALAVGRSGQDASWSAWTVTP